jgi:hypothetical protein
MEYRLNLRPERTGSNMPGILFTESDGRTGFRSEDIGPDSSRTDSPPMNEHFALKRSINLWVPPTHPSYNSLAARLRSFKNWSSEEAPKPDSLAEAGLFFYVKFKLQNFLNFFQISNFTYITHFSLSPRRIVTRNNQLPLRHRIKGLVSI